MALKLCVLTLALFSESLCIPFLYNAPQTLARIVTSASSNQETNNIDDLRQSKPSKIQNSLDNDFFENTTTEKIELPSFASNILQQKINKIISKFRFFNMLVNPKTDEEKKRDEDFDKEFEDFDKEDLVETSGYIYEKPNAKQEEVTTKPTKFNPSDIGVFFVELIGSLVGLAYGAAAQLNHSEISTTPNPN